MLLLLLLLCLLNDHTRLVDLADLNQVLIPLENDFLYLRLLLLLMSDALLRLLVDTFLPNKDSWGALIDIAVFLWSLISALQKTLPTSNIIWDVWGRTLSLKIILEVLLEGGSVVQLKIVIRPLSYLILVFPNCKLQRSMGIWTSITSPASRLWLIPMCLRNCYGRLCRSSFLLLIISWIICFLDRL